MTEKKLSQAVAMAIAGIALTAGTVTDALATNTTMYNTYNAGAAPGAGGTDGWTHQNGTTNTGTLQDWVGTPGAGGADPRPFGYQGAAALSWAAEFSSNGALTISAADSTKYGITADIDTAKGAWQDAAATPVGWRHQLDFGLIKADTDLTITLTPSVVGNAFAPNFGISIYTGIDTSATWSHHGSWHSGYVAGDTSAANLAKVNGNNPLGTSGLVFDTFIDSSGLGPYGGHTLTFNAKAGQVYTVILGGRDGGNSWSTPVAGYQLDIGAVPEPTTISLFGIAMAGMAATRRRKIKVSQAA